MDWSPASPADTAWTPSAAGTTSWTASEPQTTEWVNLGDDEVSARQILKEKFLRLAGIASVSNPFSIAPYKTVPAWSSGVATKVGQIVSNAGNWYVAANSGTTGATPPTFATGSTFNDGAVIWTFLGAAENTADAADAPAVSITTSFPAGFTCVWKFNPNDSANTGYLPDHAKLIGGYATNNAGYTKLITFNRNATDTIGKRIAIEFETDESSVAVQMSQSSAPVQLIINGRRYAPDGIILPNAGNNYIQVNFPKGRSVNTLRVETNGSTTSGFGNIFTKPTGQIWAPGRESTRAVFISDSIFDGSNFGPWVIGGSAPQRLSALLGWDDPWDFSIGGTGYTNAGSSFYKFGERVPEALTLDPDVWVFFGSTNDNGVASATITAAVKSALQAVRAGSAAPIIVFGVWSINAAALTTETAVKAAVTDLADPLIIFVPIAGDTLPWVTENGINNSANSASVNSSLFVSDDSIHPADIGSAYMARRMANAIKRSVFPVLA